MPIIVEFSKFISFVWNVVKIFSDNVEVPMVLWFIIDENIGLILSLEFIFKVSLFSSIILDYIFFQLRIFITNEN